MSKLDFSLEKATHLNVAALHANCSNLRIQAIEEGIAKLGKNTLGRKYRWSAVIFFIFFGKKKSSSEKEMAAKRKNCALASLNLGFHSGPANYKSRLCVCLTEYQCPPLLPETHLFLHKISVRKECRDLFGSWFCHILIVCKQIPSVQSGHHQASPSLRALPSP